MLRSGLLPIALACLGGMGMTAAFADGEDGRADEDRIARLTKVHDAMLEMLRRGEELEAAGKVEEALDCYEGALSAYDEAMRELGHDPRSMHAVSARRRGANKAADAAVARALEWLARHQDEDGRWDANGFAKHDPVDDKCDGPGNETYDVGVGALALLAFLESGYTDRGASSENPYARTVRVGLQFLVAQQDDEGCVGPRSSAHYIYNHAIATAALSEAYGLTRNPRYREPAQKAVAFLLKARNPYLAWRYGVRGGDNDTSVSGWCVHALASARRCGVPVDKKELRDALLGAMAWVDKMTDAETGRTGYNVAGGLPARPEGLQDKFPPTMTEAMTASGVAMRIESGQDVDGEPVRKGVALMAARPPDWNPGNGSIDLYYWFWGTRACLAAGGDAWKAWNGALKKALLVNQHPEGAGARTGSWDPIGPWGPDGGRVYSTALVALTLRSYYRPLR